MQNYNNLYDIFYFLPFYYINLNITFHLICKSNKYNYNLTYKQLKILLIVILSHINVLLLNKFLAFAFLLTICFIDRYFTFKLK